MDQCTHEVRAEYWKKIIQACGQRPAGQSAKSWMDENGICEQSYYHWQRRLRKQAYEEMKGNALFVLRKAFRSVQGTLVDGYRIFTSVQTL